MIKMWIEQTEGVSFEQAVGDYLKNRFFFVQGALVSREGDEGWPVVYFAARGLQEENKAPDNELSLYTATTYKAGPDRIAITVRRETERPKLYNCPVELLSLVESTDLPTDYGYFGAMQAKRYRKDVWDVVAGVHPTIKAAVLADVKQL